MKKLLVVLLAAMMVLSIAAVSMAAATVEGDWRAEWIQQDSKTEDIDFNKYDLRFNIKGQVSDTVDAYLQLAFDGSSDQPTTKIKEYKVNFNQSWGKVTAGAWDAKYIPSRVLLKPHGVNCQNNKSMQILVDVPFGDAFYGGLLFDPTLAEDDMEYDVKFGYKADSFGVELHYADVNPAYDDSKYIAIDAYYNINDSIKVFAYAIQAEEPKLVVVGQDEDGDDIIENINGGLQRWEEELAPVIGATFKNIGGSKLTASFEYALCDGDMDKDTDYTPYAVKLTYGFNNKVNLEVEYQNVNEDDNKLIIRPRVKF